MRRLRSLVLMVAALLALIATPVEFAAAAQPKASAAAAALCSSPCAHMSGSCGDNCLHCDAAMAGCTAYAGCGTLVALAPQSKLSSEPELSGLSATGPPSQSLHGRAVKPEIHPPSPLDRQA